MNGDQFTASVRSVGKTEYFCKNKHRNIWYKIRETERSLQKARTSVTVQNYFFKKYDVLYKNYILFFS